MHLTKILINEHLRKSNIQLYSGQLVQQKTRRKKKPKKKTIEKIVDFVLLNINSKKKKKKSLEQMSIFHNVYTKCMHVDVSTQRRRQRWCTANEWSWNVEHAPFIHHSILLPPRLRFISTEKWRETKKKALNVHHSCRHATHIHCRNRILYTHSQHRPGTAIPRTIMPIENVI